MTTKDRMARATDALYEAEVTLSEAKAEHEKAFREDLVALFVGYGLALTCDGYEGCRFNIREITGTYTLKDLEDEF